MTSINLHPSVYENVGVFPQPAFGEDPRVLKQDPVYIDNKVNMVNRNKSIGSKIQLVVYSAIVFIIVSLNITYRLTNEIWGFFTGSKSEIMGDNGLPTIKGLLVHTVVFMIIMACIV